MIDARAAYAEIQNLLNIKRQNCLTTKNVQAYNYNNYPLSPEESMKHIQVPVDFNLDFFAAEPNVMHPIATDLGRKRSFVCIDYKRLSERTKRKAAVIIFCFVKIPIKTEKPINLLVLPMV